MELHTYNIITPEEKEYYGSRFSGIKKPKEYRTLRRVYETPFVYENLELGNALEVDLDRGPELPANTGYITITEDKPIVAVTIVGSGCTRGGYNIVEWWGDGEGIDSMKNQLVKRQCIGNLNGMHPSIWIEILRNGPIAQGEFHGQPINQFTISEGSYKDNADMIKHNTNNFLESFQTSLYENTAHFRIGREEGCSNKITIRCGCIGVEDPGTAIERYPADYAIRLVEVTVMDIE